MNSYIQTYIERDIRLLHNVRDIRTFESFISLCAGCHGQVFNNAALAGQMGGALFEGMVVTEAGKDVSDTGVLVCLTETIQQMPHGNLALPWQQFPAWLDGLLTRS